MKITLSLLAFTAVSFVAGFGLAENSEAEKTAISPTVVADATEADQGYFQSTSEGTPHQEPKPASVDSILTFAHSFMGLEYKSGGNTPAGFDCSGFTNYVYSQFGYDVPHGSVNQALVGEQISEHKARRGDLLIFTGTNLSIREPGHVGIIISKVGEPIRFIHSSSNGGVKISEVTGTRYAERLLQIRRVL